MNVQQLYDALLPLYRSLREACATMRDKNGNAVNLKEYAIFFPQVGREFPETTRDGILFVGRSVNSWINNLGDNKLEDAAADQLKATKIQDACAGKGSLAFKRCIEKISREFYPDNWFEHVAYTNLYKASPAIEGNPGLYLKQTEHEACDAILTKEIELLSPKYVIFITGWEEWLKGFSIGKTMSNDPNQITCEDWIATGKGNKLVVKKWVVDGINYILSDRPERKKENNLVAAICKLMRD